MPRCLPSLRPARFTAVRAAAAAALSTLAVVALIGPSRAEARTASFSAVHETRNTLVFRISHVKPEQVVTARATLRTKISQIDKPMHRRVRVSRVRSALSRGNLITVAKPNFVSGGHLEITLQPPSHDGSNGDPPTTTPPPPSTLADPTPSGNCTVDPATITGPSCNVLRSDTAAVADPEAGLWGNIECASDSRYQYEHGGADPSPTATGQVQGNDAYRQLSAFDGDDFYGERCELGRNTSRYGENTANQASGTFALYEQGDHKITFLSERYPENFSTSVQAWQTVLQMKQAQPYDSTLGSGPMVELQIYGNRLRLRNDSREAWTTQAPDHGKWIRYALDVVYSADPAVGSVKVYVDLNGDGDALDAGEQSPLMHMSTLLTETTGPNGTSDGMAPGDAIPDHLRLGLYHNPSIACPPPSGCGVDLDNVEVVG